ncbi:MAG: peptidylprolyl isomerase [Candidatus Marinimicrobia bacterium]|nr:peptidylprolyl isomerase [Candidatus Neomarinimicrobiota bacterium]
MNKIIALFFSILIITGIADAESKKIAVISTQYGDIYIEFFSDKAPKHVKNFYKLALSGFYNGTTFHKVVPGFLIQGGDPSTREDNKRNDGSGIPGYNLDGEINGIPHDRGIVSMAKNDKPMSSGSQFFIVVKNSRFLDNKYTAFGRVVQGTDVVDTIVSQPRDAKDNPLARIEMKVKIISRKKFNKIMKSFNQSN